MTEEEERWEQDGVEWYTRQMARADVTPKGISSLSVYCTGDWDPERRAAHEHEVRLSRP